MMAPNDTIVHDVETTTETASTFGGTGWGKARTHIKNKNVINLQENPNLMPQNKRVLEVDVSMHSAK